MSNTNLNTIRNVTQVQGGSYIVQDAPATFNQDGTLKTPVKYHYQNYLPSTQVMRVFTESRVSSVTPGFSGPNRPLFLPVNTFSYEKWQLNQSYGQTHITKEGSNTACPTDSNSITSPNTQVDNGGWAASDTEIQSKVNEAIINLRNSIRNSSINVAQAIAERKQTADTVLSAAKTIAKVITSIRRGDVIGAAKALGVKRPRSTRPSRMRDVADAASHHWLALQYGWKPLLQDVYGAAEQLAKSHSNVQFKTVRASKRLVREVNTKVNLALPSDGKPSGYDIQRKHVRETVDIRFGVTYSQSSAPVTTMKELGITNPALLAWELLPFSFVADWFLPVGNYLASLDATLGLTFVSGYQTVFRRADGYATWDTNYTQYQGKDKTYRYVLNSWEAVKCNRTALTSFPMASFPSFKNPVSVTHAVNAVALLQQLFKR